MLSRKREGTSGFVGFLGVGFVARFFTGFFFAAMASFPPSIPVPMGSFQNQSSQSRTSASRRLSRR